MGLPLRPLFAACLSLSIIALMVHVTHAAQQSAPAFPSTSMPGLIGMCEDSDGCSDWTFTGAHGAGIWADGAVADLTITRLDATRIEIHRVDSKGTGSGITANYSGIITNNWIEGEVTATWPGHQQGESHTKWHGVVFPSQAVIQNTAINYKASLKQATAWAVCHDTGNKCSAANPPIDTLLVLAGQSAEMRMLPDASAQIFLYVDQSQDGTIHLRRFDKTGILQGASTQYTGKRVGGKLAGTFRIVWPGHGNAPAGGKFVALPVQDHCDATTSVQSATWIAVIDNLIDAKAASVNCAEIAANAGDANSAATVGMAYYQGSNGVAVDYKKAVFWLQKAGDQNDGDVFGMLAAIYQKGQGVPVDLLLSHYYADRAEIRKEGLDQPGYSLSASGGSIAYLLIDMRDSELALTLDHEKFVIRAMRQGMTRVDAEEKYYKQLEDNHVVYENNAGPRCSPPDYDAYKRGGDRRDPQGKTYEERYAEYLKCQSDWDARQKTIQGKLENYHACALKHVDSNAIEQNCKL
jgi:Sel1 repeat